MLLKLYEEAKFRGEIQSISYQIADRLHEFLSDFLEELDTHIDKRLVRTFVDVLGCILRFRDRHNGLVLSELGGYLLGPSKAAAGTKRISNLFRSKKWSHKLIDAYLLNRSIKRIKTLN